MVQLGIALVAVVDDQVEVLAVVLLLEEVLELMWVRLGSPSCLPLRGERKGGGKQKLKF